MRARWPVMVFLVVVVVAAAATASGAELRGGGTVAAAGKGLCNYTIIIETTCSKGAGTSDNVSLRFGDSSSNDILVHPLSTNHRKSIDGSEPDILDDVARRPFQECSTDAFKITGKCIQSQVCYLYLKHRGEDDWRLGRAQVFVPGSPLLSSVPFYFRRFLPRHVWHGTDVCSGKNTPFGIRQTRKVYANKHD